MSSSTVRISAASRKVLRELAERNGTSMQALIERALEEYRRQRFLEECNAAYAAVRADPSAWAEVEAERRELAGSLMDGLDPRELWSEDGNVRRPKRRRRKR